ncbi:hypothetical protein C5E45_34555 [Nocardia nova]|uniref:Uncharacterized protein n=1 Tax=Nocardia nova TaxID=37330 RepID=A0A2S6A6Z6_9NOCA|nr:hypothetical protein C5E41_32385 [Nocardia nova]PPJ28289.1 hypothetical protein C5E45_34555 [Nocardia nova]
MLASGHTPSCWTQPKLEPLSAFLRWFRDRGTVGDLDLIARQSTYGPAKEFQELEDYQNQLRRCLTDDSLALDVRVAGALIRLYGMSLDHIVELTKDRFQRADEHDAYLTISNHPVLLPPSLARLVEQLIAQRVTRALLPTVAESRYLFPGTPPTRPRTLVLYVSCLPTMDCPASPHATPR